MDRLQKVALVGDYLPRRCGIAQFGHDLGLSIAAQYPDVELQVIAVNDTSEGYKYPPEVTFEIPEQRLSSYKQAADYLHLANVDVVSLQHEYGIYGGEYGSHILALLKPLGVPVVTTFHTILEAPSSEQKQLLIEMAGLSASVVSMTEKGKELLQGVYGIPEQKIEVIPHGIPDTPFVDPNFYKDQFGVEGKHVIMTFGLLSPNKGVEDMIAALPAIVREVPNTVYLVVGATHPHLVRTEGESYRLKLERMVEALGVKDHVVFYNRFVSDDELREFLGVTDVYVTPYLNEAQITSGTLAYAYGCGKAVVSTPYWHAAELLSEDRGVLVPFHAPEAIASAITSLLKDDTRRHAMRKQAYLAGRNMTWNQIGARYYELIERTRRTKSRPDGPRRFPVRTVAESPRNLPELRLGHLMALTDDTGIVQHARYSVPNRHEGYCTDDNARALLLTVLLREMGIRDQHIDFMTRSYASFLEHAFDRAGRVFRNFLSFDRRWLETKGSPDSHGRAMWALGTVVGRLPDDQLASWAAEIFNAALPSVMDLPDARSWAFTAMGLNEYLQRFGGNRQARQACDVLLDRFEEAYRATRSDDWEWYEPVLTYDNARLAEAVILLSKLTGRTETQSIGIKTFDWLCGVQQSASGHFRPIGSDGFYRRGGKRAVYDQQPLEACASVSAAIAAYKATGESKFYQEAHRAYEWFLGRNDLESSVYHPATGGCFDGIGVHR
ncbi:MAG: glycosyltransferase family 4 protein, partial [Spirochaetales bacterium]